jgi:hypothetical protein
MKRQISGIAIVLLIVGLVIGGAGGYYAVSLSYEQKIKDHESTALLREEFITKLDVLIADLKVRIVTLETTIREYASVVRFISHEKTVLEAQYEELLANYTTSLEAQTP